MATAPGWPDVRIRRADAPDLIAAGARAAGRAADAHLAHAPAWFAAIRNAYGHEPLYLAAEHAGGGHGVLPAFIVRRPLLGTLVSSMPFLDGGGPCSSSDAVGDALVARLVEEARAAGAAAVEVRCRRRLALPVAPREHKVNLALPLPADAGALWSALDGAVRNQVRKAQRSGLSVEFGGAEKLDAFYAVFAARMRELGSPVHSPRFFAEVFRAFAGRARVALVRTGATPVGGLVALASGDALTVPWASCLGRYLGLCPNMLLYWEAIARACAEGFRRFDFGRSSRGSGTHRFKRQWGAREEPLFWYTVPLRGRGRPARPGRGGAATVLAGAWRRLPLALTRRLGPHFRRYLTQ
jgi:FemAB-related protein (PEP-CTERM system-associated)